MGDSLSKYNLAIKEGKDIVTLMDDNINTLTNANFGNRAHIKDMKESFDNFINDNNICPVLKRSLVLSA